MLAEFIALLPAREQTSKISRDKGGDSLTTTLLAPIRGNAKYIAKLRKREMMTKSCHDIGLQISDNT